MSELIRAVAGDPVDDVDEGTVTLLIPSPNPTILQYLSLAEAQILVDQINRAIRAERKAGKK